VFKYFRAALLAIAVVPVAGPSLHAQDWRTITSMRQYRNEEALEVSVEYGAGKMFIMPGADGSLYKATLRYDADAFKPVTHYENGRLRIGIEGGSVRGRNMKSGQLDLALSTTVPLDLDLKFGAVQAVVDLGGLRIREAHIQTGASETHLRVGKPNMERCGEFKLEVGAADFNAEGLGNLNCGSYDVDGGVGDVTLDFNGAWRVDTDVKVDMGLGQLTLVLPRGLGVRVEKGGFLASFDSEGLIKRGDAYYSENWDKAGNRVSFNIDAAFGAIRIQWVEPEAEFRRTQR
jgi:hypothetical protein